ncbi:MAG: DUF4019 domain-containing protein [Pyrinomonadaceae bacterium]
MTPKYLIAVAIFVFWVGPVLADAQTAVSGNATFTTPGAPWTLSIEGFDLEVRQAEVKPDEKSGYFLMLDNATKLNISIFIEPVDKCKTSEGCREHVLQTGNPAWGKFQDLAKGKIGEFSYFEFYRPQLQGQPLKMQDMYAEYVANDYWIDLHISKVLYSKEDHALFENVIKAIKFVPKGAKSGSDAEKLREKVEAVAVGWLLLFDQAKCSETYNALRSISRKAVSAEQWNPYCRSAREFLGKLKTRKLITSSFVGSLQPRADLSGATLRYQSMFDNTTVIEFVSLTLEKNGTWTVSNYLTQ